MTLNDLERHYSPYFAFFSTELDSFTCRLSYVTVVEDTYNVRKILSPSSSLPFFAKKLTHPAARSLCDS